jgi:hypothetical protein
MTERHPEGARKAPDEKKDEKKDSGPSMEQRLADLELQLAQTRAGTPLGTIPDHGAGPGQDIAETWSQAEQEQAKADADAG